MASLVASAGGSSTNGLLVKPTRKHVDNCQFTSWFSLHGIKKVTFRSITIPIPEEFVEYLNEDGVILPKVPDGVSVNPFDPRYVRETKDDDWADEDYDDSDESDEEGGAAATKKSFPGFEAAILKAIEKLGGKVFVKTNWSSPRDAVWVSGTLQCQSVGEIILLLKSSDFVSFDLEHAYDECREESTEGESVRNASKRPEHFCLVLRKWCNLFPSQEFRCFVKDRQLIATSQRDPTKFYNFLPSNVSTYSPLVSEFFDTSIRPVFPDDNFSFDVYIDRKHRVWLQDFNVFSRATNALLFTWAELLAVDTQEADAVANEFRVVQDPSGVQSSQLAAHKVPADVVNDPNNFIKEFVESCRNGTLNVQSNGNVDDEGGQ
jgi:hypothetical protein